MLGRKWLLITGLLLVISVIVRQQPVLLVITLLFFLTSGIARLWSRYSLQRLEYKREISSRRVFFGETITMDISLSNSKFLPLPWINVEEEVPEEVSFLKGKTVSGNSDKNRPIFSGFFSMSWYHRLTRRYPIQCLRRGVFIFGPGRVNSGDPFGFFRNTFPVAQEDQLIVYPRIVSLEALNIPSRHPFGDLRIKRHLFEDPVQVMTTRDYVPGDPMKRIHWKASARLQRLQSRVFEYTTTMDMAIFLDTRTIPREYYWNEVATDLLETAIITATAIADRSIRDKNKVGLYANELYQNTTHVLKIPPSEVSGQFKEILEALAHIRGIPFITVDRLISREARQLSWETTIVLITAVLTDENIATLRHFRKAGRRVALVLIGRDARAVRLDGITVYNVPEDVYQKQMESVRLEPVA